MKHLTSRIIDMRYYAYVIISLEIRKVEIMNQRLPIIVKFYVKEDKLGYTINELQKILGPTRKEKGCVLYELHQDIDNPNILMFYEIWETVEDWKRHDVQEHINVFREATKDCFEKIEFNKLKPI